MNLKTMSTSCIFCKIVNNEVPAVKVWENDDFIAILDIMPNTKGMTLVLPKKHYDSYAFDLPDEVYKGLLLAAKTVAKKLEKALGVKRVAMVMEGMGVNHVHVKLYPLHGVKGFEPVDSPERVFFERYPGFVCTKRGPMLKPEELEELGKKIREA